VEEAYQPPVARGDRIKAGLALTLVAASTGVSVDRMVGPGRRPPGACRARWLSMYLAHVGFGWTLERVGHAFGVNRTTTSAACRWAETARDRPALDALIERLEACVRELLAAPRYELTR